MAAVRATGELANRSRHTAQPGPRSQLQLRQPLARKGRGAQCPKCRLHGETEEGAFAWPTCVILRLAEEKATPQRPIDACWPSGIGLEPASGDVSGCGFAFIGR